MASFISFTVLITLLGLVRRLNFQPLLAPHFHLGEKKKKKVVGFFVLRWREGRGGVAKLQLEIHSLGPESTRSPPTLARVLLTRLRDASFFLDFDCASRPPLRFCLRRRLLCFAQFDFCFNLDFKTIVRHPLGAPTCLLSVFFLGYP